MKEDHQYLFIRTIFITMVAFLSLIVTALVSCTHGVTAAEHKNIFRGSSSSSISCVTPYGEGSCQAATSCDGYPVAGYCSGNSNIECCVPVACDAPNAGICKDVSKCNTTHVLGYCPGGTNIQCCINSDNNDDKSGYSDDDPKKCIVGEQVGCATRVVNGLTNQIISELNYMGYNFRAINPTVANCVDPCTLQDEAATALETAVSTVNDTITINSAFRSSAQQYLLYQWYLNKICGISLAAVPGQSNHESGSAIDTSAYTYWTPILAPYNWIHSYPDTDPVHFDYVKLESIANYNLLAFQRLWNRHNPTNQIDEDGVYGPATANAFYNSPCDGW